MSGLPDADAWLIDETKLAGYLLSEEHPTGRSKALFFVAHGFERDRPAELAAALRAHATRHDIARVVETQYGTKYVIDGAIDAPDGSTPGVRAIWIVLRGEESPRFVSAYPLGRRR